MNVWGRSLRLHIPLKDIFLMHYLVTTQHPYGHV